MGIFLNIFILNLTIWCVKFIKIIYYLYLIVAFKVQQRYITALMLFFCIGLAFSLRMSFSIILTQMVYIPNVNNETAETNGELVCPIKYPTHQNETITVCYINFNH